MLEQLFGSLSRARIIKFFCTHETERFYLRELARTLDIKVNGLSRELDNLENLGFLTATNEDRKKYYAIDPTFPLREELKGIVSKSTLLLQRSVVRMLQDIRGVQVFILTGIFANQDTGTDILLVGSFDRKRIQSLITGLSRSFYQNLRFTLLRSSEFRYRLEVTDKFIYAILNSSPITIVNKYSR
ncbi:MAG: hypothetical protein A3B30_04220 [Candidatus Komeilibacteria bacterium RIFCSPLOWO2_01_FULL_52_15]|uniref:HTH arsR-type domain-containing protein n=1 Tax=Candidatus Komeilibacteria bacterium RIFCSPLOWO2_01_FULL_52_15 TaxID=1798551 RepID=A0A1G2BPQ3_9BACT|nr:MAG: hypothetical protein A3B30_04220 [Candidatus Komeilibacteria bacterium RIFCSPLOWO2_01_FULL_52_15]